MSQHIKNTAHIKCRASFGRIVSGLNLALMCNSKNVQNNKLELVFERVYREIDVVGYQSSCPLDIETNVCICTFPCQVLYKLGVEVSDNRGRIKVEYYRMLALGCLHV